MSKRVSIAQRVNQNQRFKGDKVFLPDEVDMPSIEPAPAGIVSLETPTYVWEKFRLTHEQFNKLYLLAHNQGRTTSELVREALDYYLASR